MERGNKRKRKEKREEERKIRGRRFGDVKEEKE